MHKRVGKVAALLTGLLMFSGFVARGVDFEVSVSTLGQAPLFLQGTQEVAVDDIVFDYHGIQSRPAGSPADLATAAKKGFRLYSPGQPHWGNARISLSSGPDSDVLHQWWQDAAAGKGIRKNISVTLFKSDKTAGRGYNFFDCFPVRWKAPELNSNSDAAAQLTVNIGRIEFVAYESAPAEPGNVWATFNDGNGGVVTDRWDRWGGGEPMLHLDQFFAGTQFRDDIPGQKSVGELAVVIPAFRSKKGYDYWMTKALQGEPWLNSLSVTETGQVRPGAGASPRPGRTYTYFDGFPVRYVFPRMSVTNTTGNVMEEVTLRFIRVELK